MQISLERTIPEWLTLYQNGETTPQEILPKLLASYHVDDPAWITIVSPDYLDKQLTDLIQRFNAAGQDYHHFPLYGIPFAVKDNIDAADMATTAACPDFAYTANDDAYVIQRLKEAGAIMMGKTNLDQFATGLVGTRSPYGEVPNSFNPDYISGGSSSGSASVVARGLVAFSLGTDTAGSGRVPAGFNNLVGLKPTRGALSTRGLVPACRSLDCISVFAFTVVDAETVLEVCQQFDPADSYSRPVEIAAPRTLPPQPVFGIPDKINWFNDQQAETAFETALEQLQSMDVQFKKIDFSPLYQLAVLLYEGPWVAERMAALTEIYQHNADAIYPVVRQIIGQAEHFNAVDCFNAQYERQALLRQAQQIINSVDALCVPTTPTIYTRAQLTEEPVLFNSRLGTFTNFVNLADWCALALPGPFRQDGLPAGFTLIAPAWHDRALTEFGKRWQDNFIGLKGAVGTHLSLSEPAKPICPEGWIRFAVVGAHLDGMPLNYQLTERHAYLVESTRTSDEYRLFALANTQPAKPGLVRIAEGGAAIAVELWDMPLTEFGSFVSLIPPPLGIGTLTLSDGREVHGFICESPALQFAQDITQFGGWRMYLNSLKSNTTVETD